MIESKQLDNKILNCIEKDCQESFSEQEELINHSKSEHNNLKLYFCNVDQCQKIFRYQQSLSVHQKIHNGQKNYICPIESCKQAFVQQSNLKRHIRIHTNEKPYNCEICQKAFNTSSNLKQHQQIHNDEQNRESFSCKFCSKEYRYKNSLKKHLKSKHKNQICIGKDNSSKNSNESSQKSEEKLNLAKDISVDIFKDDNQSDNYLFLASSPQIIKQNIKLESPNQQFYLENNYHLNQQHNYVYFKNFLKKKSNLIEHNKFYYFLYDDYLFYDTGNSLIKQQYFTNEAFHPLDEKSHYINNEQEIQKIYQYIAQNMSDSLTLEMLQDENNCNVFTCDCLTTKQHNNFNNCQYLKPNIPNLLCKVCVYYDLKESVCLCKETSQYIHQHGPGCGHQTIFHDGHIDYIVNEELHHKVGNHCDFHGSIKMVKAI